MSPNLVDEVYGPLPTKRRFNRVSRSQVLTALEALGSHDGLPGINRAAAAEKLAKDIPRYTQANPTASDLAVQILPAIVDAVMSLSTAITMKDQESIVTEGSETSLVSTVQLPWGETEPAHLRIVVRPEAIEHREIGTNWHSRFHFEYSFPNDDSSSTETAMDLLDLFVQANIRIERRRERLVRLEKLDGPAIIADEFRRLLLEAEADIVP